METIQSERGRDQLLVDEEELEKKIKMVTLISLAESQSIIPLQKLTAELGFEDVEQLEEFLIDAIRANAVNGRIDQNKGVFVVTGFQHREFGRSQWELLQKRLSSLLRNMKRVHDNLDELIAGEPIET